MANIGVNNYELRIDQLRIDGRESLCGFIMLSFILLLFVLPVSSLAQTLPYPDNSSPTAQYIKWGVPDLNKNWSAADYREAFKRLDYIYGQDKFAMPRSESTYSGKLFAYMVSPDRLQPLHNPAIELRERFVLLESLAFVPQKLQFYYTQPRQATERFGREGLESIFFSAILSKSTFLLVNELKENVRKSGQTVTEITKVYVQTKEELGYLCLSLLDLIDKKHVRFQQEDIEWFSNKASPLIRELMPDIEKSAQKKVLEQAKDMAKNHPYAKVREAMKGL